MPTPRSPPVVAAWLLRFFKTTAAMTPRVGYMLVGVEEYVSSKSRRFCRSQINAACGTVCGGCMAGALLLNDYCSNDDNRHHKNHDDDHDQRCAALLGRFGRRWSKGEGASVL